MNLTMMLMIRRRRRTNQEKSPPDKHPIIKLEFLFYNWWK